MNKYQVTINLVVEVEADTETEACYRAKDSIDYGYGEVMEEDILDLVVLELRCTECDTDLDPSDCVDITDGATCTECEEQVGK